MSESKPQQTHTTLRRGRPRTVDHAEALRLRDEEGLSYPAIGLKLGCHHTTALYACNAAFRERHKKAGRESAKWRRRMHGDTSTHGERRSA